ncbi:DUF2059 domain-containing protein [Sagittula sp. NFXS13]|uniref:DUF2059 domain-containing protein n=1 Tax=Sagittula sp. NFXS13 TaxID=2819095 RepID=UPI0032DF45AF
MASLTPIACVLRRLVVIGLLFMTCLGPARAEPVDDLLDALQIDAMLGIMREEGIAYGRDLGNDMFMDGSNPRWQELLAEIYDPEKMQIIMRRYFDDMLDQADMKPLVAFFDSETGAEIVELELSARRAMIDDGVEEAARSAYQSADTESARLQQITQFIETNDLLEANVAGALNASFKFYSGLVDGGGLEMSEGEILSDVWAQEAETRADTREWLYGFLMLAYEPLSDDTLDEYIEISGTPEGRVLNRALFAGFNAMYDEISYALGLAAARQMQSQEL